MSEKHKFSELCNFTDKQKEASKALKDYKYVLYGGAMGGGKSYWLRWMCLKFLLQCAKKGIQGVNVGLFCEDYPALKDRQISKISTEFPSWIGTFHSDHKAHGKSFILNTDFGGGVIVFRNLDDPSKYQSAEFAMIAVDEITKNVKETFEDLRNRMRWPGINEAKFISATNPGGKGHGWVKQTWIDRDFGENEVEQDKFKYIQSLATDNPHLSEDYHRSLDSLPEQKRKAFRDGDWNIFKGQYFSEWRNEIHTCSPFDIPKHWPKFVCGDYGYRAPSAVLWCAVDEDDVIWVYREIYETEKTYEQLTEMIISMTQHTEEIDYYVFDPAIWAKKDSPVSGADKFIQKYKEIVGKMPRLVRGNNDRVVGWNAMREHLKPYQKEAGIFTARIQVFNTCTETIRTLPSLVYDKHKVEDLDSDGDDHIADAIRYGIMSKPNKAKILLNHSKNPDLHDLHLEECMSRSVNRFCPV